MSYKICPCNKNLLDFASEKGRSAVQRVTPLVDQAMTKVGPYVDQAIVSAEQAGRRAAGFTADRIEQLQPSINAALDRVAPTVDRVQHSLQDNVVPQVLESLRTVSQGPTGQQAKVLLDGLADRSDASLVAFQTELAKAQQAGIIKKASKTKTVLTIAALGALVAALAVAVKTFLGSREDWAAYEPDEPYVYPDDDPEIDAVIAAAEALSPSVVVAVAEPAVAEAAIAAEQPESAPFGDGSYAGPNPPEGFTIKGNERSMKYHLPGATGYARTNADVWFSTEAAAEAAGFVRSQR